MLIKCPECNHEVSDKAEACPECGYPLRNRVEKCEYCKGSGKNPHKNRGLINPAYPHFGIAKLSMAAIMIVIFIISWHTGKHTGQIGIGFFVAMIAFSAFEQHVTKLCPKCNGSGMKYKLHRKLKPLHGVHKLVPPNKKLVPPKKIKKNQKQEDTDADDLHNSQLLEPLTPPDL